MSELPLKPLNSLSPGETAVIREFEDNAKLQSRLAEIGALPGIKVRMIKKIPFKGPLEIKIRSYYLSIRWQDACQILVS